MTLVGRSDYLAERANDAPGFQAHGFLQNRKWARVSLVSSAVGADFVAMILASVIAAFLRFDDPLSAHSGELILIFGAPYFLAAFALGAYQIEGLRSGSRSISLAIIAAIIASAMAMSVTFALQAGAQLSRLETGYMVLSLAILLAVGRALTWKFAHNLEGVIEPKVFVLADHDVSAGELASCAGSINVKRCGWMPRNDDPEFLSKLFMAVQGADRVILNFSESDERAGWIQVMRYLGVNAEFVDPDLSPIAPLGVSSWGGTPTLVVAHGPLQLHQRVQKRIFDTLIASAIVLVSFPLLLAIAILIKLDSRGPVLFTQERLGRNNVRYRCHKFRTMREDAADMNGQNSTMKDDQRVTRIGRLLRRTSLDELPQLFAVLTGEMSLVGPRPHAMASTAEGQLFWEIVPGYWCRHAIKPGITGLAQVRGLRGATHLREDIEKRVAADLEYISKWSLLVDLGILLKTFQVLIHKNAY